MDKHPKRMWRQVCMAVICVSGLTFAGVPLASAQIQLPEQDAHFDHNYARYTTTMQCATAVQREIAFAYRSGARDTLDINPDTDTLPTSAVQAAEQCLAHFSVATVPTDQLMSYAAVALQAGWDDSARRAIDQRVAIGRKAHESAFRQGQRYVEAAELLLGSIPTRVEAAEALVPKMRGLGPGANVPLMTLHRLLLNHAVNVTDVETVVREAQTILQMADGLPPGDRGIAYHAIFDAIKARLMVAVIRGDTVMGQQAVHDFWKKYVALPEVPHMPDSVRTVLQAVMARAKQAAPVLEGALAAASLTKLPPAPQPQAQHWYDASGHPVTLPQRGMRLIQTVGEGIGMAQAVRIRHMMKELSPKGLQLILLSQTQGDFQGHVYKDPNKEAERFRMFLQDSLHVPGILGIYTTQFKRLPDGRYRPLPSPNQSIIGAVLIDSKNRAYTIIQLGVLATEHGDAWLSKFIERIIRETASS